MKKNERKKKLYKFVFMCLFLSFMVIYLSELSGYYEYKNNKKATLTSEQIKKFEADVASGKEVDIKEYLIVETKDYDNGLSIISSKLSDTISSLVQSGVENTFKFLSRLVDS